jgi:DNA polymerase-3 subunit delta'
LDKLKSAAPQVLLLEGGRPEEREAMAVYWALGLNCAEELPCRACPDCIQILDRSHRDFFYLDGAAESIKIDQIRELRSVFGEPPRGRGKRVVVLAEAQSLTIEAANALLKSLEEPKPWTRFVLLAPQRERLLPTLVSRGWVLTLGWTPSERKGAQDPEENARIESWLDSLAGFVATGRGWMQRTGEKGGLDKRLAFSLILRCQQELADALLGQPKSTLAEAWTRYLDLTRLRRLDLALGYAQDALTANVSPGLVMDWLATRLYAWKTRAS